MAYSDIASCLSALDEEVSLVGKLLVRNANQHGRTKVFGYLRRARKITLEYLCPSELLELSNRGEQCLRTKASLRDQNASLHALTQMRCVLRSSSDVIFCALRAYVLLCRALHKKIYVPLYSVLIAQSSRLGLAAAGVFQLVDRQVSYLISHLRHIATVHSEHAPTLEAFLRKDAAQSSCGSPHSPRLSSQFVQNLLQQWQEVVNMEVQDVKSESNKGCLDHEEYADKIMVDLPVGAKTLGVVMEESDAQEIERLGAHSTPPTAALLISRELFRADLNVSGTRSPVREDLIRNSEDMQPAPESENRKKGKAKNIRIREFETKVSCTSQIDSIVNEPSKSDQVSSDNVIGHKVKKRRVGKDVIDDIFGF